MPTIGESKIGHEIGKYRTQHYYWAACIDCGMERWVGVCLGSSSREDILAYNKCNRCRQIELRTRGSENQNWRGGQTTHRGYIRTMIGAGSFYFPMLSPSQKERGRGYVFEHRLVMARYLGRLLKPREIVHHLNAMKDDNRIGNLAIVSKHKHSSDTYIKLLQKRIRELEGDKPISIEYIRRKK